MPSAVLQRHVVNRACALFMPMHTPARALRTKSCRLDVIAAAAALPANASGRPHNVLHYSQPLHTHQSFPPCLSLFPALPLHCRCQPQHTLDYLGLPAPARLPARLPLTQLYLFVHSYSCEAVDEYGKDRGLLLYSSQGGWASLDGDTPDCGDPRPANMDPQVSGAAGLRRCSAEQQGGVCISNRTHWHSASSRSSSRGRTMVWVEQLLAYCNSKEFGLAQSTC